MAARTWSEWFWLPRDLTWQQVELAMGSDYPDSHRYWKCVVFFGIVLLMIRNYIIIPFLLEPIGRRAGIREKPYAHPPPNEELEVLYKINRARPPGKKLTEAAAKINWTERRVERWLRMKSLSLQMTTMEKFCEQGWQAVFYSCFFIGGIFAIVPQTFFWDTLETMSDMPFQDAPPVAWWYSAIDCGFYVTQTITLFSQQRRHDFYIMLCHHVVTFSLHFFCVSMNIMKLLALTVFLHEIADIPLAIGKMFDYSKKNHVSDLLAIVFALLWVSTRLIAYPAMAMRPPALTPPELKSPCLLVFKMFGLILLFLHISWTMDLIQAIKRKLTCNRVVDTRSSPEELSEDERSTDLKNNQQLKEQLRRQLVDNVTVRKRHWIISAIPDTVKYLLK